MQTECFIHTQFLPISEEVAWAFFSNPQAINHICPSWFKLDWQASRGNQQLRTGQVLHYQLSLWGLLRFPWVLVMSVVEPPNRSVAELKVGPFHFWHAERAITRSAEGVKVQEIVHYTLPNGLLQSAFRFAVRFVLERAYTYREQMLIEFFGEV